MLLYNNRGGDSGVHSYGYGDELIQVQFSDGSIYEYTYQSAGIQNIETMKQLADAGEGLNSFINKKVRKKYQRKVR